MTQQRAVDTQILLTVCVLCVCILCTLEVQADKPVHKLEGQLKSEKFIPQLKDERNHHVNGLIAIVVDQKADPEVRVRAVEILGEIRASKAAPTLVVYLDKIQPRVIKEKTIETIFPCVPALIKIGKPGAEESQKELRKPMNKLRQMALVVVIAGVEGRKVGKLLLEDDIHRLQTSISRPDVEAIKNLKAALKTFLAMTANERDYSAEPLRTEKPKR